MSMGTIAVDGLGNMGVPMAINIAAAGYNVVGFDVSSDARGLSLPVCPHLPMPSPAPTSRRFSQEKCTARALLLRSSTYLRRLDTTFDGSADFLTHTVWLVDELLPGEAQDQPPVKNESVLTKPVFLELSPRGMSDKAIDFDADA